MVALHLHEALELHALADFFVAEFLLIELLELKELEALEGIELFTLAEAVG
jgi:hypothetical protein